MQGIFTGMKNAAVVAGASEIASLLWFDEPW